MRSEQRSRMLPTAQRRALPARLQSQRPQKEVADLSMRILSLSSQRQMSRSRSASESHVDIPLQKRPFSSVDSSRDIATVTDPYAFS